MVGRSWWQGREKGDRTSCSECQRSHELAPRWLNNYIETIVVTRDNDSSFFLTHEATQPGKYPTNGDRCGNMVISGGTMFLMIKKLQSWKKILMIKNRFSTLKYGLLETEESLWGSKSDTHITARER